MSEITTTTTASSAPTSVTGPGEVVSPALPEPGWKTSEFYLYLVPIILGALLTSGLFADGSVWARGIGAVLAIFGALGYGGNRSKVKAAASNAGVVVVAQTDARKFSSKGSLVALALVFGLSSQMSCGAAGPVIATAGPIAIDCLAQDQAQLVELVGSLWSAFTAGGSWQDVKTIAIANGKTLGGCAFAAVVQKFLAPPRGRAAPSVASGRAARDAFEDFRANVAGGATYMTSAGAL